MYNYPFRVSNRWYHTPTFYKCRACAPCAPGILCDCPRTHLLVWVQCLDTPCCTKPGSAVNNLVCDTSARDACIYIGSVKCTMLCAMQMADDIGLWCAAFCSTVWTVWGGVWTVTSWHWRTMTCYRPTPRVHIFWFRCITVTIRLKGGQM